MMNILTTFLRLTNYTVPYGMESTMESFLPLGIQVDEYDNYFIKIGESRTMFTSHLDTVCSSQKQVNHVIGSKFIKTDGTTTLGADDKAGVTLMLYMIEKQVPGLYYFFIGEEVGGIGSGDAAYKGQWGEYDRCISFDRKGYNSIITEQFYGECCSLDFAQALCQSLNDANVLFRFKPDDTGSFTDSASFMDYIPECTNVSVGYFKQHTYEEHQDIRFLTLLADALILVDWENLPTVRDPEESYYSSFRKNTIDDSSRNDNNVLLADSADLFESERTYAKDSKSIFISIDKVQYLAQVSEQRLKLETLWIENYVLNSGDSVKKIWWDGATAYVEQYYPSSEGSTMDYLGTRAEITEYIPGLAYIPLTDLNLLGRTSKD